MTVRRPSQTASTVSPIQQEQGATSSSSATTTSPHAFRFTETIPTITSPLRKTERQRSGSSPLVHALEGEDIDIPGHTTVGGGTSSVGLGLGSPSGPAGRQNRISSFASSPLAAPFQASPGSPRNTTSFKHPSSPSSGGRRRGVREYWKRAMILNPIKLPIQHPYIRLFLTVSVWAVGIWTILHIALPSRIADSAGSLKVLRSYRKHPIVEQQQPSSEILLSTAFPLPESRPIDSYPSPDPRWRPILPLSPPSPPFPRLRATRFLPSKCMESWFADGEMFCSRLELGDEDTLDVTWLWVNGSDTRWKKDLHKYRDDAGIISPDHHFR